MEKFILILITFSLLILYVKASKNVEEKPDWAKKDIRDYTDADMERLLEQWEEGDDPLDDDELPEHLRPMPQIDMSKLDAKNPEELLQATKKGRTLMTFVNVFSHIGKEKTEEVTKLWQSSLWNNHIQAERYLVDDHRAIFLFKDGAQAWIAKDFLVDQELCESVTIENKVYEGKFAPKTKKSTDEL